MCCDSGLMGGAPSAWQISWRRMCRIGLTIGGNASPVPATCGRVRTQRRPSFPRPLARRMESAREARVRARTGSAVQCAEARCAPAAQSRTTCDTTTFLNVRVQTLSIPAIGRSNWSRPQEEAKASCERRKRSHARTTRVRPAPARTGAEESAVCCARVRGGGQPLTTPACSAFRAAMAPLQDADASPHFCRRRRRRKRRRASSQ